jgi:hypothetical protein
MIHCWIWEQNLWPCLETIASFVNSTPDEYDREAIIHGLSDMDVEQDNWFDYSFGDGLMVEFARDIGTEILFVRVKTEATIQYRVSVALAIFQNYRLMEHH